MTNTMEPHKISKILFTAEQIQTRIDELVLEMAKDCDRENFVMIGVLRGSFMFLADLVRDLHPHDIHPKIDFCTLESYGSATESSGNVCITKDVKVDLTNAHVLLIDDILDSGRTLNFARKHILNKGAAVVKTCTLLDKPSRRVVDIQSDYNGFTVDDVFVVGYGLDYDSHYRELPYIAEVTLTNG